MQNIIRLWNHCQKLHGFKTRGIHGKKQIRQRLLNKNMICGSGSDLATGCWKLGRFHRRIVPYIPYFLHLLHLLTASHSQRYTSGWDGFVISGSSWYLQLPLDRWALTWTSLPGSNFIKAEVLEEARPLLLLFIPLFVHLKWLLCMEPVWILLTELLCWVTAFLGWSWIPHGRGVWPHTRSKSPLYPGWGLLGTALGSRPCPSLIQRRGGRDLLSMAPLRGVHTDTPFHSQSSYI